MRGLFVTATDTDVGKTIVSAALLAAMRGAGERVLAHKPVVTGLRDARRAEAAAARPADHELLAAASGMDPERVAPLRYGPAVAPHLAAALAGESIDPGALLRAARAGPGEDIRVVEGVGGLLCPLAERFTVCDLAAALRLGVLIAARPGLGTINHTLLTLRAARAAGLEVLAVVLTPWPAGPSPIERSNRETIARIGEVEVQTLAHVPSLDPAMLARAGSTLPWRQWLRTRGQARPHAAQELTPARAASTTAAATRATSSSLIRYAGIV